MLGNSNDTVWFWSISKQLHGVLNNRLISKQIYCYSISCCYLADAKLLTTASDFLHMVACVSQTASHQVEALRKIQLPLHRTNYSFAALSSQMLRLGYKLEYTSMTAVASSFRRSSVIRTTPPAVTYLASCPINLSCCTLLRCYMDVQAIHQPIHSDWTKCNDNIKQFSGVCSSWLRRKDSSIILAAFQSLFSCFLRAFGEITAFWHLSHRRQGTWRASWSCSCICQLHALSCCFGVCTRIFIMSWYQKNCFG